MQTPWGTAGVNVLTKQCSLRHVVYVSTEDAGLESMQDGLTRSGVCYAKLQPQAGFQF